MTNATRSVIVGAAVRRFIDAVLEADAAGGGVAPYDELAACFGYIVAGACDGVVVAVTPSMSTAHPLGRLACSASPRAVFACSPEPGALLVLPWSTVASYKCVVGDAVALALTFDDPPTRPVFVAGEDAPSRVASAVLDPHSVSVATVGGRSYRFDAH